MITELDIISIVRFLEKDDIPKARDILSTFKSPESNYEKGYQLALNGLVGACVNKEKDSIFYKLVNSQLPIEMINNQREICKRRIKQNFRDNTIIGYEHAWEFILSYFLGDQKMGLDKYQRQSTL